MSMLVKKSKKNTDVLSFRVSKEVKKQWLEFVKKNKINSKSTIENILTDLMEGVK